MGKKYSVKEKTEIGAKKKNEIPCIIFHLQHCFFCGQLCNCRFA